ncbi:MAG: glycosyltransferase family 2 protein [Coriobacteriaceae bacterium]|jgi:glycosyltransferase involved in cell wall biosynthesis|nr:glycosyltransferase family 2 protein [Coriobacteriaceae bacterium]
MDDIAVLIPCYNEEKTIGKVVRELLEQLPNATVYVYDNNSSDNTAALAQAAGAVVRREHKQGKGNVIRRMFREIEASCYLMVDGDDTYPAECAPAMVEAVMKRNVDMVIGDRLSSSYFVENKRRFHNAGNVFVRNSINMLFKCEIRDIMTGFRGFSYLFVKSFPVLSQGFEIETEMSIHAVDKNMLIENIIVDYRDRPEGSVSKLNTITDGAKVIKTILSLLKNSRPFAFFAAIAVFLAAVGIVMAIPVFGEFFRSGLVPRIPTLIICVFLWLAATHAFFTGLTLDIIRQKNMQDFEMRLHDIEQRKR